MNEGQMGSGIGWLRPCPICGHLTIGCFLSSSSSILLPTKWSQTLNPRTAQAMPLEYWEEVCDFRKGITRPVSFWSVLVFVDPVQFKGLGWCR